MPMIDAIVSDHFTVIKRGTTCHVVGDVTFYTNNVTLHAAAQMANNIVKIKRESLLTFTHIDSDIWVLDCGLFPFEVVKRDETDYLIRYSVLGTYYSVRVESNSDEILSIARAHYCKILTEIAGK